MVTLLWRLPSEKPAAWCFGVASGAEAEAISACRSIRPSPSTTQHCLDRVAEDLPSIEYMFADQFSALL